MIFSKNSSTKTNSKVLVVILQTRPTLDSIKTALEFYRHAHSIGKVDLEIVKILVVHDRIASPELKSLIDSYVDLNVELRGIPLLYKIRLKITHELKDRLSSMPKIIRLITFPVLTYVRKEIRWHSSYYPKVYFAANFALKNGYAYLLKYDEDILLTPNAWKIMTKSGVEYIKDEVVILTPTLSTGVPTWHTFMKNFCSSKSLEAVKRSLASTNIPFSIWEVDYSSLANSFDGDLWNEDVFQIELRKLDTVKKGFHPIRFNPNVSQIISTEICDNFAEFMKLNSNDQMSIETKTTTQYLCNNLFLIKSRTYRDTLRDLSAFIDPFDEIPVNDLFVSKGKKYLIFENVAGIHYLYGSSHSESVLFYGSLHQGLDLENALATKFSQELSEISNAE